MNNVYIHARAELQIFDKFENIIDETDWNEDKHLLYSEFSKYYYSLEDIEYAKILNFTKNKINNLLSNDEDLKMLYPNCSFYLKYLYIYSVYDNSNEKYF